ncbi:MAG: DUF3540 domain-containing protein [Polyangiaceae bacterium]
MGKNVMEGMLPLLGAALETRDGAARASLTADGRGIEVTQREDGRDVLVLRVVPSDGRLTLSVPKGDLRLQALSGAIELTGAEAVRMRGKRIEGHATEASFRVGTWRVAAGWVRERATHVVRDVEQTLQTSAKQVRTRVRGLFQLTSERTTLRSKDDTAIDGKRVLLG